MGASIFKVLGGSLLTLGLVWALVLGWWQSNDYQPAPVELALYLGAIPLALIGAYFLFRGFIEHLRAPLVRVPPALPLDADPLAPAESGTGEAERGFTVGLLDTFLCTPAGNSAADLLAAIEEGRRPAPGTRLLDVDGFPVFLAEVVGLDVESVKEGLGASPDGARLAGCHEVLRALALVDQILPQAGARLLDLLAPEPALPGQEIGLQILWLVPAAWEAADLPLLEAWFLRRSGETFGARPVALAVLPAATEAEALGRLDELIVHLNREPAENRLVLLLSAASAIDERSIESWAARGELFSARHQQRRIPGEGGAALLLAPPALVARLPLEPDSVALLGRVGRATRDKPVEAKGRVGGTLINQLIQAQLQVSGLDSAALKAVVSDADHRAGLLAEVLDGLGAAFAQLDPLADCPAVGSAIGSLRPAGSLVALACAASRALADEGPVLCLSQQSERERAALLVRPLVVSPST